MLKNFIFGQIIRLIRRSRIRSVRNVAQIGNRKYLTLILILVLKLKGSNRLEDLDVEVWIILKLVLIEWVAWKCGQDHSNVEMWAGPR